MTRKYTHKPPAELVYFIDERDGHYFVYYLQVAPVQTLFDVTQTREQAEQAIKDHQDGKHPTQYGEKE